MLSRLKNWFLLSRAPFLPAGILPFIAGSLLAQRSGYAFCAAVFWWAVSAVTLTMLAANLNGEAYDIVEDSLSAASGKSLFAGGSGVVVEHRESPELVKKVCWYLLGITLVIGCILQFGYHTGPLTLPLGISGILAGFFYSKLPFRWVKRGFGELLIAYSYGWLPIAVGFYLQAGRLDHMVNRFSLPIAFSIFNVILANEYLDYDADKQAGKRNLLIRLGKARGAYVYVSASLLGSFFCLFSLSSSLTLAGLGVAAIAVTISCFAALLMIRRGYEKRSRLEAVCGLTITANLLFPTAYIAAFLK